MTDRQYVLGFDDGFKAGVESASDIVYAKCWDEAFNAGYRAAKQELID
jgi:hypothetical protein